MFRRIIDVVLIYTLSLVLLLAILIPQLFWLRAILGTIFLLFFPGYVLNAAMFPKKSAQAWSEKIAWILGLSLATVVLTGLVLSFTGPGISLNSLMVTLNGFILICSVIVYYRRKNLAQDETIDFSFSAYFKTHRMAPALAFSAFIVLCAAGLGFATRPPDAQPFTEFYILDATGKTDNYPASINAGETGYVTVDIVNNEGVECKYLLAVRSNKKVTAEYVADLGPGESWEKIVGFKLEKPGEDQKIEFVLKKGNSPEEEIRYLWLDVK